MVCFVFFFFFSSRRRHTRWTGDWSSDVCSSDLEDFPFQPIATPDFYARSKRMAEDVVREAATHRDLEVAALRPTVIYGERDRLFTPRVLRAARLRFVPRIGPGTNRLSCVYAGNVASAAVAALDAPLQGFRAYNVTSDGRPGCPRAGSLARLRPRLAGGTWRFRFPCR